MSTGKRSWDITLTLVKSADRLGSYVKWRALLSQIGRAESSWYWLAVVTALFVRGAMAAVFTADDFSAGTSVVLVTRGFPVQSKMSQQSRAQSQDQKATEDVACVPESFKIALDVGHTPQAPGATSARGVKEYMFNQQLAKQMERKLVQGGFTNTTSSPREAPAGISSACASNEPTRLAPTYFCQFITTMFSRSTIRNGNMAAHCEITVISSKATRCLSLATISILTGVSAFAKLVGRELKARGLPLKSLIMPKRLLVKTEKSCDLAAGVYRYDDLFVLKFSAAPAVLLEAGIIVNRNEELALSSPERRDQISGAVLAALKEFCGALDGRPN